MAYDKAIYKKLSHIVAPIALQYLMSSLVTASDAFMLGFLDQDSLSASSLAGQIAFVFSLFYGAFVFGLELLSSVPDSVISKLIGNSSPSYIIFRSSDIKDKTVIDKLTRLNSVCEQQKDGYELSAVTLCYETAVSLFERCTGAVGEPPENSRRLSELHAMIGFIQGHYNEKLSLEDISASGQVCRSKCFELFREFVGKTPVDYLNEYVSQKVLICSKARI